MTSKQDRWDAGEASYKAERDEPIMGTCLSCRAAGIHWDAPRDDGRCYECGGEIGKWNERNTVLKTKAETRQLVYCAHTRKWETAHRERNTANGGRRRGQWVRDDMSFICYVGQEIAVAPLPPKP